MFLFSLSDLKLIRDWLMGLFGYMKARKQSEEDEPVFAVIEGAHAICELSFFCKALPNRSLNSVKESINRLLAAGKIQEVGTGYLTTKGAKHIEESNPFKN